MKKSILILSYSDTSRDPRVLKQVAALKDKHEVTLGGLKNPKIPGVDFVLLGTNAPRRNSTRKVKKISALILRNFSIFHRLEYGDDSKILTDLIFEDFDLIIANDFSSLPLAVSQKALSTTLYLDAHEYIFDELNNKFYKLLFSGYRNWLWDNHIKSVNIMTTVGDRIRDLYKSHPNCPEISVIRNVPCFVDLEPSISTNEVINLVHHGSAVRGRGLSELIHQMKYLDNRFVLNLVLVPTDKKYFSELKNESLNYNHRVFFHEPVEVSQIPQFISRFDIGIYLIPPLSKNNVFALPNKFFEFIQGRLGLIVGPAPEMANIVLSEGLGLATSGYSLDENAKHLNNLTLDDISGFKRKADQVAFKYSWDHEVQKLLNLF